MNNRDREFLEKLQLRLDSQISAAVTDRDMISLEVPVEHWLAVAKVLRDDFNFEQLTDLCGVDYLSYGQSEWDTEDVSGEGFSRAVEGVASGRFDWQHRPEPSDNDQARRFCVVAHLLSIRFNRRVRIRCFVEATQVPRVASLVEVWASVNWFEREAFDLFGIVFDGHPDLRRILTDYGFVGHPFRKDFPLIGNVEVRYDPEKRRVVYEPVSIEPRVLVPRVLRDDSRYAEQHGSETPTGGSGT